MSIKCCNNFHWQKNLKLKNFYKAYLGAIVSSDEEGENEITNQTIDDFNLYLKNGISQGNNKIKIIGDGKKMETQDNMRIEQEDNKQKEVMDFGCEEDRLIAELTRKNEILRSQETKLAYEISDWSKRFMIANLNTP